MDFVVRLPLIDFDIYNEVEISSNFGIIKKAIKYSSPSLFLKLSGKEYSELDDKIKIKVYKYLKRGKYRSIPFKNWAGLGLGLWGNRNLVDIQSISEKQFVPKNKIWEKNLLHQGRFKGGYIISPFLIMKSEWIVCLSYNTEFDDKEGNWEWFKIRRDENVDVVLKKFKNKVTIREDEFSLINEDLKELFQDFVKLGILVPDFMNEEKDSASKTIFDSSFDFVSGDFFLRRSIKPILQEIPSKLGSLFSRKRSKVIEKLKKSIKNNFDDRFVSVRLLLDPSFQLWELFDNEGSKEIDDIKENGFFKLLVAACSEGFLEVDISENNLFHEIALKHESIDYLFRINQEGCVIIDNLLVDQKGKISSRFSLKKHELKTTDRSKVKAEVMLCESRQIHHIYTGNSIYDTCLYIDGLGKRSETDLIVEELYIGILNDVVVLYDDKSDKIVEPNFCTPISYTKLTHPLAKLLWHISEDGKQKFDLYQDPNFLKLPYSPRISWGKIILMPRKWYFKDLSFENITSVKSFLSFYKISKLFLIGDSDAELLINAEIEKDLILFLDEVKKLKEFFIYEYIDVGILNEKEIKVYPQFHYSSDSNLYELEMQAEFFINKITLENLEWTSLYISVDDLNLESVLLKIFQIIDESEVEFKWYFLVYDAESTQIRVRFNFDQGEKQELIIKNFLYSLIYFEGVKSAEKAIYYPELDKYGELGISISEVIFFRESAYIKKLILNQSLSDFERILIISKVWTLFLEEEFNEEFLTFYGEKYKQLNQEHRYKLQKEYQKMRSIKYELTGLEEFKLEIFKLLKSHPFDNKHNKLQILLNHIHMFSNRLLVFGEREDLAFYHIYRVLLFNRSKKPWR